MSFSLFRFSKKYFLLTFIIGFVAILQFSFTAEDEKVYFKSEADFLLSKSKKLMEVAEAYKFGYIGIDSLQKAVRETRIAYKKLEFVLGWWYPEFNEEHFNGAPLLKAKAFDTRPVVVPPEGLQVLDELVFSDNPQEEKVLIASLGRLFYTEYASVFDDLGKRKMSEEEFLLAARAQLIRIFTLGVTGFDTPGSLNVFEESTASLQTLLNLYKQKGKNEAVEKQFLAAMAYLSQNQNFDGFDRLEFLKNHIDPLYKILKPSLVQVHDFRSYTKAWNASSESIFDEDFLDPYYFTELSAEDNNEDLYLLGKALFYDPLISENRKMSCATCHQPELAFTDGQAKSMSQLQGKTVQRNAPTLLNAVYSDRYFYDLRAFTLEQQAEHVIFNSLEFNTAYADILHKLKQKKEYQALFKKAFNGHGNMDREGFSKALAAYVMSLKSFSSPVDKYIRGEKEDLPNAVKNGFNLFMGKAACGTCHFAPTFAGLAPPFYDKNESEILGVLESPTDHELDNDEGRHENQIYAEQAWIYKKSFKTGSVRNVGLTSPYFHNGAYTTLEEVVDFYNEGGGAGIGLEVTNQTLPADKLNLTEKEKSDLVSFMKALTDTSSAKNLKKSNL